MNPITHFIAGRPTCPVCGAKVNGAAPADAKSPSAPAEGDFSVCIECATPLRFAGPPPLHLRAATWQELQTLRFDEPDFYKELNDAVARVLVHKQTREN